MCRGRFQCDVPTCDNPVILPGQCCFQCPDIKLAKQDKQSTFGCTHNEVMYEVGAVWNPVVRPFGVIKCAECTCLGDGQYNCSRTKCPEVKCDHPIKKDPTDCCFVCVEEEEKVNPSSSDNLENSMQADSAGYLVEQKERSTKRKLC